jgi:DNA gyrase subunit B
MYIGDTADGSGLNNMICEVIINSVNEARTGHCDRIDVLLNADGSATVRDNGRGIPFELHPETGIPAAEMILTQLILGGVFGYDDSQRSRAPGVGLVVVNALSEALCLNVWRNEFEHTMRFHAGVPEMPSTAVKQIAVKGGKPKRGTEITFLPDPTIFAGTAFDLSAIERRLREFSEQNSGVIIALADRRMGRETDVVLRV